MNCYINNTLYTLEPPTETINVPTIIKQEPRIVLRVGKNNAITFTDINLNLIRSSNTIQINENYITIQKTDQYYIFYNYINESNIQTTVQNSIPLGFINNEPYKLYSILQLIGVNYYALTNHLENTGMILKLPTSMYSIPAVDALYSN